MPKQRFKPYSKRKIFKRKTGGPKFYLNGGVVKTTFSRADMEGTWANLMALIMKSKIRKGR